MSGANNPHLLKIGLLRTSVTFMYFTRSRIKRSQVQSSVLVNIELLYINLFIVRWALHTVFSDRTVSSDCTLCFIDHTWTKEIAPGRKARRKPTKEMFTCHNTTATTWLTLSKTVAEGNTEKESYAIVFWYYKPTDTRAFSLICVSISSCEFAVITPRLDWLLESLLIGS